MSRIDPACFPYGGSSELVCTSCIGDDDLKRFIRAHGERAQCEYCTKRTAKTIALGDLAEFVAERLATFYGRAVDQLPYDSREGGYQGWHPDTHELLFDHVGLDLPRDDDGNLARDLSAEIGDDAWTEYDWLRLEPDKAFASDWDRFCEAIKSERRYFIAKQEPEEFPDPDSRTTEEFFADLAMLIDESGLIKTKRRNMLIYRARAGSLAAQYNNAAALGSPPRKFANKPNRMNAPGIPMFYGADNQELALAEVGGGDAWIGKFRTNTDILLLDLATLPKTPGFFSEASREYRLGISFLRRFAELISQPVRPDDHLDYLPTQALAEYLRSWRFKSGKISGIRYPSATKKAGANVVLFATQSDIVGGSETKHGVTPWLRLSSSAHVAAT